MVNYKQLSAKLRNCEFPVAPLSLLCLEFIPGHVYPLVPPSHQFFYLLILPFMN